MNSVYGLLDKMRTSIISIDLSYSRTTELLNQILEIEKAVDSEERPKGEWILQYRSCGDEYYTCSICERAIEVENGRSLKDFPYCHCGADMRKGGAE